MHFEGFEDFNTFYCVVSGCTTLHLEALGFSLPNTKKNRSSCGIGIDKWAWEFHSFLLAVSLA